MVAFATLFLGLVLGSQAVEVVVDGSVAAVEIRLDGATQARRDAPPWFFVVDLGDGYEPHILEAVGFDTERVEVARAEQWLNVPRREVEAEIVLDGGRNGQGVVARVLWESRLEGDPERIRVSFDGRPLAADDPERIELPNHNPAELHLLQVELEFQGNFIAVVDKTFGGSYGDEVESRLTAVPIALPRSVRPPSTHDLVDRFTDDEGARLEVVAVDEGPAELFVVRDLAAQPAIDRILASRNRQTLLERTRGGGAVAAARAHRFAGQLKKNQLIRFLYPVTVEMMGHRTLQEQFPTSRAYAPSDGGLPWLMGQERRALEPERQRLAEAVAVAGMAAAQRNRRRAVLLIVAQESTDASRIGAEEARSYLASLRVPLVVWSLEDPEEKGPWGPQQPIRNLFDLSRESRELSQLLSRQRIVWLRGRHLPQKIALVERGDFLLAR